MPHAETPERDAHIDEETLERFALGKLTESEAAGCEEHLLTCVQCQDWLAETEEYIRVLRAGLRGHSFSGRQANGLPHRSGVGAE